MKTNDIFIVTATAAYSYLFYNQHAGINFFLFNILIVLLLFMKDKSLLTQPTWLAAAAGSLLSSFFVFWLGTPLQIIANICSLIILTGVSFNPQSSLLFAAFNTIVSVVISIPRLFHSTAMQKQPADGRVSIFKKLLLLTVPALITLVFIAIYSAANPIFARFVNQINFDFISFDWIIFTLSGFFIMFGIFNVYRLWINVYDNKASDTLHEITAEEHVQAGSGSWLSAPNELMIGVALFALLNLVLLTVNALDVFYMWVVNRLPEGVTIAEFLHDSTDSLIFSIVLAIAVILFVFRGYLNFIEQNKWLKIFAWTWIMQNVVLVITTANTNWWYIQTYGLTRKRIGVYVYLLLCVVGLITTWIKISEKKSNWFLLRKNAWAFYAVFIVSCFINWDEMIVNYNCSNYKTGELNYIDLDYQTDLSYTCLGTLFKYYAAEKRESNPEKQIFTNRIVYAMYENYKELKEQEETGGWQSYCLSRHENYTETGRMIKNGEASVK